MSSNIIFVISSGRTGSTLLCQLLTHFQNTVNLNESLTNVDAYIAHYDRKQRFAEFLKTVNIDNVETTELHAKLLEDPISLITNVTNYFSETIVAKLHLNKFDLFNEEFLTYILTQPNHKFILLERKNYLEVYISEKISERSGLWHNVDTTDNKIKVDIEEFTRNFEAYVERSNFIKNYLKRYNIDFLEVEYDKDLKNYNIEEFVELIHPWANRNGLSLSPGELPKIKVRKQNKNEDIFNNIENAKEVKEFLSAFNKSKE